MITMYKFIMLPFMIFLHIVDDFYLQGILAKMKQKKWWKDNLPDKLYKYDYICALIVHAFSWSFMILIPVLVLFYITNSFGIGHIVVYLVCLIINTIVHAITDDHKANEHIIDINFCEDQIIHLSQVFVTFCIAIAAESLTSIG